MGHHKPVLKLNADFRPLSLFPLSVVSQEEAIRNIYEETAFPIHEYDEPLRSQKLNWKRPSVIVLKQYVKTPRYISFTRYNVFLRDHFKCQYCGKKKNPNSLTFDHVIPRSAGGQTCWENIVAACHDCNTAKDSSTDRKKWKPLKAPKKPTTRELLEAMKEFPKNYLHESWLDYLYWDSELEVDKS